MRQLTESKVPTQPVTIPGYPGVSAVAMSRQTLRTVPANYLQDPY